MGLAELIKTLEKLPSERQAEVFDFVEFLAQRYDKEQKNSQTAAPTTLADLLAHPVQVDKSFKAMTRNEIHDRAGLR